MRRWVSSILLGISLILTIKASNPALANGSIDKDNCTYKGKKLYGKVQIVEHFPDIKVKVVSAFPNLKVKPVTVFPDKCGEWQIVEAFPDIKVQFVDAFPDIEIQFVDAFPGTN